jgi:Membrane domain of glycerophosphoryl diester phosphodiesterase
MNTAPQLRPMTIGDMFDAAFRLYRANVLTFIGIVALLQVPVAIIQFLVQVTLGNGPLTALQRFSARPPTLAPGQNIFDALPLGPLLTFYAITLGLGAIQYLLVQNLLTGALANAIAQTYLGRPISILSAYGFGARRYVALIAASLLPFTVGVVLFALFLGCMIGGLAGLGGSIGRGRTGAVAVLLVGLLLFGLLVLLVLAALFFLVRFLLTTQAIVLEGQGPLAGLRRSWRLIGGAFWRTVGIVLLMGLLTYIISAVPAIIASFALALGSGGSLNNVVRNQAITTLLAQIGLIIGLPLQLGVYTLLYYDLRVRKEGYDLELLAQQAAQS